MINKNKLIEELLTLLDELTILMNTPNKDNNMPIHGYNMVMKLFGVDPKIIEKIKHMDLTILTEDDLKHQISRFKDLFNKHKNIGDHLT